jgi:hypothetical protein
MQDENKRMEQIYHKITPNQRRNITKREIPNGKGPPKAEYS